MVYSPLSTASHRKVCGPFGRAKQSHEPRSALMYGLVESIAVLCCLHVTAESDPQPCQKDCTHTFRQSLRCMYDLESQSRSAGVSNPLSLLVNRQQKYSLVVSFKRCKVALKTILCYQSKALCSPAWIGTVNTHFQLALRINDLKEEWCGTATAVLGQTF